MKRWFLASLLFLIASTSTAFMTDGFKVSNPQLLAYTKNNLSALGTLQKTKQGYVYVTVSEKYITDLLSRLKLPDFVAPRYANDMGAHISVMYEAETESLGKIAELGEEITFEPLGFYKVVIHDKEFYMLAVDAPKLSYLREKYGLSKKLQGHEFHITIGVKQLTGDYELEDAA